MEYGHFNGEKYTVYTNAKTLKGAVTISMKVTLRKEEKALNKTGLQALYREIGDSVAEIMSNDSTEKASVFVSIDEMASYFTREGWVTEDRKSIDNSLYHKLVLEIIEEIGVEEEEFEIPK